MWNLGLRGGGVARIYAITQKDMHKRRKQKYRFYFNSFRGECKSFLRLTISLLLYQSYPQTNFNNEQRTFIYKTFQTCVFFIYVSLLVSNFKKKLERESEILLAMNITFL